MIMYIKWAWHFVLPINSTKFIYDRIKIKFKRFKGEKYKINGEEEKALFLFFFSLSFSHSLSHGQRQIEGIRCKTRASVKV